FAQAKRYDGGGRILVLADHSVFINSMLLPQRYPNDNLSFAFNCLDWLMLGPGDEKRKYVMFMEDGRIWQNDDYNLMLQTLPTNTQELLEMLREHPELLWQSREFGEHLLRHAERSKFLREVEREDIEKTNEGPYLINRINKALEEEFSRYG